MSLPALITIADEAQMLLEALGAWARERGGTVKFITHAGRLWEEFRGTDGNGLPDETPRILVCYEGETARGGFTNQDHLHRVDRKWFVVVIRGHGFKSLAIEEGVDVFGGPIDPFLDQIEDIRETIRLLLSISEEFPVNYTGIKPVQGLAPTPTANVFLDAYRIDFTTANDIPRIDLE